MSKRKKKPILIMEYADIVYFLEKKNLNHIIPDLDVFLKSQRVKKNGERIIDQILGASLHINEAESAEYFRITAEGLAKAKMIYVGIKKPTYMTSASPEAKHLKKFVEWGADHRTFLREKVGQDYDIETYFTALGIEICLLAWIKKQTTEVFLGTIVNRQEALLGNTERRLKIVTHTAEINRFIADFSALTKTTLRMDEKDTLKEVFLNAVMIYEGNDVAFNYEHFRSVIGINTSTKPYYLLSEKSRTTLGNAIRAAKAH